MKVEIIKDATLTVKAGQTVDLDDRQALIAVKLGLAKPFKETKTKRAAK